MARMLTTLQILVETLLNLHRPLLQTRLVLEMAENGGVVASKGPSESYKSLMLGDIGRCPRRPRANV